jgi:hypothetical protein
MTPLLSKKQKVIYAVGAVVLCCHEIEKQLKFLTSFTRKDANNSNWNSIFARHQRLSNVSLGVVAGQFLESASGDAEKLKAYVKEVIDQRNTLVHHFSETYGEPLSAGRHEDVLVAIQRQHRRALDLLRALQETSISLAEALRDTTFLNTEEYEEFAALCKTAREQLDVNISFEPNPFHESSESRQ